MTTPEQIALVAIDEQRQPILEKIATAENLLAALKQSDAKLFAARQAITGEKAPRTKAGGKSRNKAAKPFACKDEVLAVCKAIIRENGPTDRVKLESLTKAKLGQELGFSLSGVPMLLGKALASNVFTVGADDVVSVSEA